MHSSDATVEADAAALAASQGLSLIKPEPVDPPPVKFTGNLGVIDDELEIIDFVPAQEVCHTGCQVKQEPLEHAPHFPQAALHHHPTEELQEQTDAPNPMTGHVRVDSSDHPTSSHIAADDSQLSTSGAVLPPATSSSSTTPVSSVLPQDITVAVALPNVSRSATLMPCAGRHPVFVHSFQLSTIDPLQMVPFFMLVLNLQVPPSIAASCWFQDTSGWHHRGQYRHCHLWGVWWVSPQHLTYLPYFCHSIPLKSSLWGQHASSHVGCAA